MKMNKLNEYDNMKKFFLNNEIVNDISQYVENDVENVENINDNKKNENDIVNNEKKKKKKKKNNNDKKMNRLVDNSNHINNQIFNDIIEL